MVATKQRRTKGKTRTVTATAVCETHIVFDTHEAFFHLGSFTATCSCGWKTELMFTGVKDAPHDEHMKLLADRLAELESLIGEHNPSYLPVGLEGIGFRIDRRYDYDHFD